VRSQIQIATDIPRDTAVVQWRERLGLRVLRALSEKQSELDAILEILRAIVDETGVANAGIRLKDGDDYPYIVYHGFNKEFIELENTLCVKGTSGSFVTDDEGVPALVCLCGRVIGGRTDPEQSFFTRGGSFFTPRLQTLANTVNPALLGPLRGRCIVEHYETHALIPLRREQDTIGLIHLTDPRKDYFTPDDIEYFEKLGVSVGIAISCHRSYSEREKRASEAQRVSEQKFYKVFSASPEAICITALSDGTFIDVNDIFQEVSGYRREHVLGRTAKQLDFWVNPEERRQYVRRLNHERRLRGFEAKLRVCSGEERDFLISSEIIAIEGCDYSLNFLLDITNRKRAEVERQQLQTRLFEAQKAQAVGTLAGGIAHDFNNLLGGIMGGLSLMDIKIGSYLELHQEIEEIMDLVERGADLTKQLLGFARLGKFKTRSVDLNQIAKATCEMYGRTRRDIVINAQYAPGAMAVEADRTQIEQVLLNLLVNAGQAMPEGGEVTIRTELVDLSGADTTPHGVAPGKFIKLSITDTGVGMDAETRERIFEPFFTTKVAGTGSGLGLASVLGIVKNHGGIVEVQSELGQGSTFSVELPATDRPVAEENTPSITPRRGSETILIVDDEEHIVKTSKLLLEAMGYEVLTAVNGREAVDVYRANLERVALVILDMTMPGMSGGQTFDALREVSSKVKVLLSSGYGLEGQATAILERGCNGFIQKPFNVSALSVKLKELI
jgi:PAS domain S-box-containing protein